MTTLYAMTEQMRELASMLDSDDASLVEAIQDTMQAVEGEIGIKADAIVMLSRNMAGDIAALDSEIDRLSELKRVRANGLEKLKEYLKHNMEAANIKNIDRPLFKITLVAGTEKCVIDAEDAVPDDYVSVKTSVTPDKRLILAKLKEIRATNAEIQSRIAAGDLDAEVDLIEVPEWARIERGESSLRIK